MYCRNCGSQISDKAVVCVNCGLAPNAGKNYCQNCGSSTARAASVCIKCGVSLGCTTFGEAKSKLAAGLLGIFLGVFGVHRFYLGYTGIGVAQLVLGLLGIPTCGITAIASSVWGLIEGILILTGTISQDAQGNALNE